MMENPFILGIGEVLWDMLPEGKRCGGAPANVVYHLTQLGDRSAVVSAVGRDAEGDELLAFLKSKGLTAEYISRSDLPTGRVNVTVSSGIPSYEICRPAAWDAIAVDDALWKKMPSVSAMIWGSLAQRDAVSRTVIQKILAAAPPDCLKCFDINLRQDCYSAAVIDDSLKLANVLKINDEELDVAAKLLQFSGSQEAIMTGLFRRYGLQYIICTLGSCGSMLFDGRSFTRYPVKQCRVVDTVGCGDAFLAGWCHAVLHGRSAQDGMAAGTELAAEVAGRAGAMG